MARELWRPVVGYEGWYEVSSGGRVKRVRQASNGNKGSTWAGRILTPQSHPRDGHQHVNLSRDGVVKIHKVHHLVLTAFCRPRSEGEESRHLDGDPENNAVKNLRWGSRSENIRDRIRNGGGSRGERSSSAKLNRQAVKVIRRLRGVVTGRTLAGVFSVTPSTICQIQKRERWRHVK